MDRRGFLKFFGAGVAGIAIEQAIPLGRVWSFPKEIVVPKLMVPINLTWDDYEAAVKSALTENTISLKFPQRFLVRDGMSYLTTATAAALRASRRSPS